MNRVLLILLLCFPVVNWADDIGHDDALRLKQSGEILPLESILKEARQHHDGKVLEVELEKKRGTYIYEIEILDNSGVLWEMKLNAMDGSVVSEEVEN
ncbi:PepSY domain-containing protein [Kaarinaea lacus]